MTIDWSENAQKQFISSLQGIHETLLLFVKEKRFFLIPEIILQWIEDLYLYKTGKNPYCDIVTVCTELSLTLTHEESKLLRAMEQASRKEESYRKFIETLESPLLLSLIQKIGEASHI